MKNWFKSNNDYFNQPEPTLKLRWAQLRNYLNLKGYNDDEIAIYSLAYDYFCDNPGEFDGATMTEDLNDLFNLDLDAMLHDFFYIAYNVAASYRFTQIADNLFYEETLRKGKSSWNAGLRKFLLKLKSILGFSLYATHVMGREMSEKDITDFLKCVHVFKK